MQGKNSNGKNSNGKKQEQLLQVKALILLLSEEDVRDLLEWRETLNPLDVIDPGEAFLMRLWEAAIKN